MKKFLHRPLLVKVLITMEGHLLLQRGQARGEVLDLLPETEGEVLPLLAQSLSVARRTRLTPMRSMAMESHTSLADALSVMMASSARRSSWYGRSANSMASYS
jgi:hypothetical protein